MYDTNPYKHNCFPVGDRTVVWFIGDEERSAAEIPSNNLFILDKDGNEIWSMKDALKREDTCTLLRIEGKKAYFATYNGFGAWIDVQTLEITDKRMVR
ncbi:MAG: hypothetical protein J1E65_06785 [Lachnospiraceae bacterium]|nr:hypothetical protein [Lachnospiraceae bacterium]